MHHDRHLTRRTLMAGAVGMPLLSLGARIFAQAPLVVPQVDRLTLHTIVDNATFGPFLADQTLPGLLIERAVRGGTRMPTRTLMAEFGLSILAISEIASAKRQVLVDFGYSPEVLLNNIELLGIDPKLFDAAVLSHGHLDQASSCAVTS